MALRRSFLLLVVGGLVAGSGVAAQRGQRSGPPPADPTWSIAGTWALESTRGDRPERVADAATSDLPAAARDRAYRDLLARLEPPSSLMIERDGRRVSLASSRGPWVTVEPDGRRYDDRPGGRAIGRTWTRAEWSGPRLVVTYMGNRRTDFVVMFEVIDRGGTLLVTRQLDSDDLRRPAEIRSYYRRVEWRPVVPSGTRLVGVLETPIHSRSARGGERFSVRVRMPAAYRDAIIDGVMVEVSPWRRGAMAEVRVFFDRMRFAGRESDFDGVLVAVRTPDGRDIRVDDRSVDLDRDALEKGAVGATLGAVIGAILGGGKGAAAGAVIGGVSGILSAQDHDLDLPPGTEVTIIARAGRPGPRR